MSIKIKNRLKRAQKCEFATRTAPASVPNKERCVVAKKQKKAGGATCLRPQKTPGFICCIFP
jgi:hypothetical protein